MHCRRIATNAMLNSGSPDECIHSAGCTTIQFNQTLLNSSGFDVVLFQSTIGVVGFIKSFERSFLINETDLN